MASFLTFKDFLQETQLYRARAFQAVVVVILLLACLLARIAFLQLYNYDHYSMLSDSNRIKLQAIAPTRGLIYDRNGVLLADNSPSYSLVVVPERVKNLAATIAELKKLIDINQQEIKRFYKHVNLHRPFIGTTILHQLNDKEISIFSVNQHRFKGVQLQARLVRHYPFGPLLAHAVGYVGRINKQELQNVDAHNYRATDQIGKIGLEKQYESLLHGTVGLRYVETDSHGKILRTLKETAPTPGYDLHLSLDVNMQQVAASGLKGRRGAAVAIDPSNGEVLVLLSEPSYDPNLFVSGIDSATYQSLNESLDKPLFNRALRGQYPPASTVKPFIGLIGLDQEVISTDYTINDPGWYQLNNLEHKYRDWKKYGHGQVNLAKAIMESCDIFFYDLAHKLGIDTLHERMSQFGFGSKTGIDLGEELAGLMPSRQWKSSTKGVVWYPGETIITGIGQGFSQATPLQLAQVTARLAQRGNGFRPKILSYLIAPDLTRQQRVTEALPPIVLKDAMTWDFIHLSMYKVTTDGTAKQAFRQAPYHVAGKTGTAQLFTIKQDEEYQEDKVAERRRHTAIFVAFAPMEKPRIAISIVVENAGHGGSQSAPIARAMFDHYFLKPQLSQN